jgi:hypothetical protein
MSETYAGRERRRPGRPRLIARRLEDMREAQGPPLRIRDIAALTGFSKQKVMADVRGGYLVAREIPCGRAVMWVVPFSEAQRYLRELMVLSA